MAPYLWLGYYQNYSLSQYIAKHNRILPKTEKLSAANQNWARKTPKLRPSIRIENQYTKNTRKLSARVEEPFRLSDPPGSL